MDGVESFGAAAVAAMLLCYALESRGPHFVLLFAAACRGPAPEAPPPEVERARAPTPAANRPRVLVLGTSLTAGLGVAPEQVVPVCLKEGRLYNVEEALAPAILSSLGEANRVKLLRCLRHFHQEEYWGQLWKQAKTAGRLLWNVARGKHKAPSETPAS